MADSNEDPNLLHPQGEVEGQYDPSLAYAQQPMMDPSLAQVDPSLQPYDASLDPHLDLHAAEAAAQQSWYDAQQQPVAEGAEYDHATLLANAAAAAAAQEQEHHLHQQAYDFSQNPLDPNQPFHQPLAQPGEGGDYYGGEQPFPYDQQYAEPHQAAWMNENYQEWAQQPADAQQMAEAGLSGLEGYVQQAAAAAQLAAREGSVMQQDEQAPPTKGKGKKAAVKKEPKEKAKKEPKEKKPRAPAKPRQTKEEKYAIAVAEALANGTEPPPNPADKPTPAPRKTTKTAAREAERKAAQLAREQESDLEYNREVWVDALQAYKRANEERREKIIRWEEEEEQVKAHSTIAQVQATQQARLDKINARIEAAAREAEEVRLRKEAMEQEAVRRRQAAAQKKREAKARKEAKTGRPSSSSARASMGVAGEGGEQQHQMGYDYDPSQPQAGPSSSTSAQHQYLSPYPPPPPPNAFDTTSASDREEFDVAGPASASRRGAPRASVSGLAQMPFEQSGYPTAEMEGMDSMTGGLGGEEGFEEGGGAKKRRKIDTGESSRSKKGKMIKNEKAEFDEQERLTLEAMLIPTFHSGPHQPNSSFYNPHATTPSYWNSSIDFNDSFGGPPSSLRSGPMPKFDLELGPELEARRIAEMEEAQRKVWAQIAKKDVPKIYKTVVEGHTARLREHKKIAIVVEKEQRRALSRMATTKNPKNTQLKSKKMMREMLVFWKRNEKDERENRKKAERVALDKAKKEEEERESKRQSRKLNFLITQTELYSHFVGSKIKTAEAEQSEDTAGSGLPSIAEAEMPNAAAVELADAEKELAELDFGDDDEKNLNAHARKNAQAAVAAAKAKADAFDVAASAERKKNEALNAGQQVPVNLDGDELNFQNPSGMADVAVKQPKMLTATLKEYQLKGLNWLANLYEQGINGILADEMGLGKTIQSIALMAYLAEVHDIWGPFLVIAPASTLHNWQQEITKFVPQLKCLPYWGVTKDRATLRKFWNRKQISYNRDAPFHVLITSYQLVVTDEKYFQRVKWQYMILDEAQAIKSSTSARWKTLLGFHCRNRLLLTGTPIQNSMHELWALLHFIMPSLFDSHDEFSEWFSRDIENAASKTGDKNNLNEHQLRRLHMILKPFMLRRVKKNVQNELGDKIEIDVYVNLSPRQKSLYQSLRSRISIADLMDRATDSDNQESVRALMNLVMQFRKVCNHPQLFERADVKAPFAFASFARTPSLLREGENLHCPDSSKNPIEVHIPSLFYEDGGLLNVPGEDSRAGSDTKRLQTMMSVWTPDRLEESLEESNSSFSALRLLDMTPSEAHAQIKQSTIQSLLLSSTEEMARAEVAHLSCDSDFAACTSGQGLLDGHILSIPPLGHLQGEELGLPHLLNISHSSYDHSYLSRRDARFIIPIVVAPPISATSVSTGYTDSQSHLLTNTLASRALFGLTPSDRESPLACDHISSLLPGLPPGGLIEESPREQLPVSNMQMPDIKRLIFDSAKLAKLDDLLRQLKPQGHRVLVFFQMTKMIDLIEEYLVYRQYKYLRLDGNSKISDRRDMVAAFQNDPEIYVFLLSTRAGGLGINLTAADTVIFYDNDWNPSNDAQAMDRVHRLGQTKQVTIYRLITKGTIDERIVNLARQKKDVQDLVVGNKPIGEVAKTQEVLSLLMDDDELAESNARRAQAEKDALSAGPSVPSASTSSTSRKRTAKGGAAASKDVSDLWKDVAIDEDDDFFGASKPAAVIADEADLLGGEDGPSKPKKARISKAAPGKTATRKPRGGKTAGAKAPSRSRKKDAGFDEEAVFLKEEE